MPVTRKRKKPAERYSRQVENRNFLAPTGFRFVLKRSPKAAFLCNQANIPAIDLGTTVQPNYLRDIQGKLRIEISYLQLVLDLF